MALVSDQLRAEVYDCKGAFVESVSAPPKSLEPPGRIYEHAEMARRTGKVAFFHEAKGYGYIEWSGGKDLYFNRAGLSEDHILTEGETVTFAVHVNDAGETQAIEVSPFPLRNRRSGLKDRRKDLVPSRA